MSYEVSSRHSSMARSKVSKLHSDWATQELGRDADSCWTKYHLQLSVVLFLCCAFSYRRTVAQETARCQSCEYTLYTWSKTALSVIFETNWMLLIGRTFLWVMSLAPFFRSRWTIAFYHSVVKCQVVSKLFTLILPALLLRNGGLAATQK